MKAQYLISKRFLKSNTGSKKSTSTLVTIIAIIGVTLGVMVPIVVLSVMEGFQNEIKSKILGVKGHATIVPKSFSYIGDYERVIREIKSHESVVSAIPYIEVQGMIQLYKKYKPVIIRAVSPNFFIEDQELNQIFQLVQGEKDLSRRYYIMVGDAMAKRNFLSIGDRVSLLVAEEESLDANTRPETVTTKLMGTFKTGFQEFDNNVVYMSLSTLQKIFKQPGKIKNISIKVKDIWDMDGLFYYLVKNYGDQFRIYSWQELNYNFFKALALEKTLMYLIVSLILIVAVFNVTSSQLIIIIERKKEIGILKTIGMKPIQIAQIFLLQGLFITSIGSIMGGILGLLISWDVAATLSLVEGVINFIGQIFYGIFSIFTGGGVYQPVEIFPKGVYYLDGIPSDVSLERVVIFMVLAMILSFITGLLPSLKAASLKPIEVMRYE